MAASPNHGSGMQGGPNAGGNAGPMGGSMSSGLKGGGTGNGGSQDSRNFNSRYTKTRTRKYEATPENLAKLGTTILGGALMPGVGIGLGPVAADAIGLGYDSPMGTADTYSYDSKNMAGQTPATAEQNPKKKKPTLANLVGTLLGGDSGTLSLA